MLATMNDTLVKLLQEVATLATRAGVFDGVKVDQERLACKAAGSAAPAAYRLDMQDGRLWVSMVTPDRWLSGSIELDLLHTGDKLADLIEEELVELGCPAKVAFEHFRSEDKLFTFRTVVPVDPARLERPDERQAAIRTLGAFLLAYEACFRNLGDMKAPEGDQ
jgi:hypothetical protein